MVFKIKNLFQFSACVASITYVLVDSRVVNWNNMVEHILFQFRGLPVDKHLYIFKSDELLQVLEDFNNSLKEKPKEIKIFDKM